MRRVMPTRRGMGRRRWMWPWCWMGCGRGMGRGRWMGCGRRLLRRHLLFDRFHRLTTRVDRALDSLRGWRAGLGVEKCLEDCLVAPQLELDPRLLDEIAIG